MKRKVELWVDKYAEDLLARAVFKTNDTETAKDLVQETFLAAVKNFNSYRGESNPKTWLFSILNNKITDFYREKYREPDKSEFEDYKQHFNRHGEWVLQSEPARWDTSDKHLLDNKEFRDIMQWCIEQLPEKYNALIILKLENEKEAKSICQELQISPTNMWQIMHRAKIKLRACLETNWFKA